MPAESRPWLRVAAVVLLSLLLGCLLVPPIVHLLRGVGSDYTAGKIARRVLSVTALLGILSQYRALALPGFRSTGFESHSGAKQNLLVGAAIGFVSLFLISIGQLYAGYRYFEWEPSLWDWTRRIANGAISSPIIAVLEEYLFRGLLLAALLRKMPAAPAVLLCSAVFGSLHFFTGEATSYNPEVIPWYGGFTAAGLLLAGLMAELDLIAFTGITLVGVTLCMATLRTGSLYLSTGIHFGWVFYIKTLGETFKRAGGKNVWFGGSQVYDGLIGPLGLLLLIPFILLLVRRRVLLCRVEGTQNGS